MDTKPSFSSKLISYLNIFLRIVVIALILVLLRATYKGLKQDGYIVQSIQVPKHFNDSGLSGIVIAKQIQDRIQDIKKNVGQSRKDSSIIMASSSNNLNIDVMGIGVSSTSLIYHLRDFLGIKTKSISGDLSQINEKLNFSLRVTDFAVKRITVDTDSLDAESAYEELIDKIAESILYRLDPYYLVVKHIRDRDIDEAKGVMREMIANRPGEAKWAYAAWGNLKYEQNEFNGAKEYLNKALEIDPNFSMPKNGLAWMNVFDGDFDEAIIKFEELLDSDYHRWGVINGLARSNTMLGNVEKAEEYYKMQIKEHPDNIYSYGNYNTFLMSVRKDTAAAIELFKDAGEKLPLDEDYYTTRAMHYFMQEKQDSAKLFLDKALDYNDKNLGTLQAMTAYLTNMKKDYDAADEYYIKMIDILDSGGYEGSMLASAYNGFAINDYMRNDLMSATEHVNEAIRRFPKDGFVYTTLGEIEFIKGNNRKMLQAFEQAEDLGVIIREDWLADYPYTEMIKVPAFVSLLESQKLKG